MPAAFRLLKGCRRVGPQLKSMPRPPATLAASASPVGGSRRRRLVLIEKDPLQRDGLLRALAIAGGMDVSASYGTAEEALADAAWDEADVLPMRRQFRCPHIPKIRRGCGLVLR